MRCPVCSQLNDDTARFCSNCGETLTATEVVQVSNSETVGSSESHSIESVGMDLSKKATLENRLIAQLVDAAVGVACLIPLLIIVAVACVQFGFDASKYSCSDIEQWIPYIGGVAASLFLWLIVSVYQLVILSNCGQTIGKKVMRIKIVKSDTGENPGFVISVLLRSLVPVLINSVLGIFTLIDICFIFREDRRCIHDMMANTDVVNC